MKAPATALLFVATLSLIAVAMMSTSGCAGTATRPSTGEMIDDATITTRIKAEFVRDEIVKALAVNVDTFKGAVSLSGFVDTNEQKSRAERIAKTVPGVISVTNNITVKGNSTSS